MKALGWFYWLAFQLLSLVAEVLGWIVLLPLAATRSWHERPGMSKYYPGRFVHGWDVGRAIMAGFIVTGLLCVPFGFRPAVYGAVFGSFLAGLGAWDNDEDGVLGADWWLKQHENRPEWWNAYVWSAWRNPANNLRFLPGAILRIDDASKITKLVRENYTVTTYGWRQYVLWHPHWFPWVLRAGWLIRIEASSGDYAWPVIGKY
jgi:hypothetical protein